MANVAELHPSELAHVLRVLILGLGFEIETFTEPGRLILLFFLHGSKLPGLGPPMSPSSKIAHCWGCVLPFFLDMSVSISWGSHVGSFGVLRVHIQRPDFWKLPYWPRKRARNVKREDLPP